MISPYHYSKKRKKNCPCGNNKPFESCCSPIFQNHRSAKTPEQLMRSRYTANTLCDEKHLLRTWDYAFRPESINLSSKTIWIGLEIFRSWIDKEDKNTGYVHFKVSYIENDFLIVLEEKSVFIKREDLWLYQQGDLVIHQSGLSLNSNCPCGSRKKYKRCFRAK